MRNTPTVGGYVCPETYHGTRMDEKALEFHTQLHEWSEAQKISAQAKGHAQLLANARNKDVYLPFKKLAQIEHWTKDVNRFYRPYKGNRPKSGHFMKIDVTKYNMKVDSRPEETRSKSAVYSTTAKGKGYRVLSAVSTSTSGTRRRFFGTDVHTVNTNLIESQIHYSAQRQEIRSATTRRPITSAKTGETKADTDANLSVNVNGLEKVEPSESETLSTLGNNNTKPDSGDSQGPGQELGHSQGHSEVDILQQKITARSWSNRMLNVISIDDCKLTCRYRPQIIKESQTKAFEEDIEQPGNSGQTSEILYCKEIADAENKTKTSISSDIDEEEADIKLDVRLNGMLIGDISRDNNNNVDETDHTSDEDIDESSHGSEEDKEDSVTELDDNIAVRKKIKGAKKRGSNKRGSITFDDKKTSNDSNESKTGSKTGKKTNSNSSQTNKTSYGRITSLYTHSQTEKSKDKDKKKKKVSRTAKLNNAINDMVRDRRVMNSMERDFDTRTAQFGRTIVDKSEGSELFQKLHSNLRKKMDTFIDTHCAVKTHKFYERKNSLQCQN